MPTSGYASSVGRNDSDISIADRYRLLIEAVHDYAIFMLEPNGRIASWNPGAQRIKGYSADEIVGRHFSLFYTRSDVGARKPWRLLDAAARDGRVEDEGWRVRKDGSQFWANVVITAVRDESGALIGFAKITRDMTQRRRLADLERASATSARVQQARENEQKRIARELHDDLGQRLAAIKLALNAHEAILARASLPSLKCELDAIGEIGTQLDALAGAVRRIAADLRPAILDDLGLQSALEWLAEDFQHRYGIRVHCELHICLATLGNYASVALFRVVQEALTNVARHANAREVTIWLSNDANRCSLRISDDGIGFDPDTDARADAFGLIGMRERITQLGGTFAIETKPDAGVTITARFPLPSNIQSALGGVECMNANANANANATGIAL